MEAVYKFLAEDELLNSSFFVAAVTLLVGLTALFIYWKRKKDNKKDAASIILLEIKNAERILKRAKDQFTRSGGNLIDSDLVMPTESWGKYKYLFVRDLDRDDWDTISEFYKNCLLYDEAIAHNNSFFQKNEEHIRSNLYRIYADYTKELIDAAKPDKAGSEDEIKFKETAQNNARFNGAYIEFVKANLYNPVKPIDDVEALFQSIPIDISQKSVGLVLTQISSPPKFWRPNKKQIS